MSRLKKIIVLTQSQYDTLAQDGSISYNGGTLTGINDDYLYITTDQISAEDLVGVLPVAHGGTGLSSIANNQLLIGNENNALVPIVKADTIENTDNAIPSSGAVHDYAVPLAGGTMTGKLTLQSGVTTDSVTAGALNLNNSNIYGVNAIYTADAADGASEGFHFYRDSSHSDTIWVSGGNIYFVPNRAYGTNTTAANSQKVLTSGNYTSYAWARPSTITADEVVLSSGTSGATQLRGVLNNTAKSSLSWNSAGGVTHADNLRFATINTLAYWNGAYSGTSSNLSILGTVTTGTWNATAIGAAYGGTGKTSLKDSANALINALDTGSSNLTANDYVITQFVGGGTTTTTYHRRPASAVRVGGLLTAHKLKVALGSTSDATFDGTADQTNIPISGTLGIAHGGTGANDKREAGLIYDWNAIVQGLKWSRICYIPTSTSTVGSSFLLNVRATRASVVYNYTFAINTHHSSKCQINVLQGANYSILSIRGVVNSTGDIYIELYDSANNIASGTNQTVNCSLWILSKGTTEPTLYTTFTDGATIPSDYTGYELTLKAKGGFQTNGIYYGDGSGLTNIAASSITGKLSVEHGGTGVNSFVSGNLLVGNGQNALTTIAKTSANTANTVVERDANGNFSAGTITATLNGKIGTSTIGTVDKPIYLNAGTLTPIASVLETSVLRSSGDEYYAYDQGNRLAYYDEQNKVKPAQSITVDDEHLSIGRRSIDEDYSLYVSGNSYISDTTYAGTIKTAQIWISPLAQIETVDFPSGYTFQAFGHSRFSNYMNLNVALELWQNNKASFRFLNDNNVFYLQDKNAADALTAYQTALSLTVNTGNIEISRGIVTINNTTASTTKATGAITIAGGAGIGGQVNAEAFRINEQARFEYNSTDDTIDLIWG